MFKRWSHFILGWLIAAVFTLLRLSVRCHRHNDPTPGFRADGTRFIYAVLHAHQVASLIGSQDKKVVAIISASRAGDLIAPSVRARGFVPIRGSTRSRGREKGGREALAKTIEAVRENIPACIVIDGPRGPRGKAQAGAAIIGMETDCYVCPVVCIPRRRWIVSKAWDRLQVPSFFTRVDAYFCEPMKFEKGHDLTDAREQIGAAVRELELKHDKEEGEIGLRLMAEQTEKRRLYKEREAQKAEDAKAGEAPAAES